ncbi:26S proteasome non-ATPase regulatory subunit 12 [Triplophysa rosa]|uniref:26S proteasome non-ATPase regulatory subunit 12 n=1 Tax=Triplophysa rosa TaxID=992332 RepID=A0A9W8C562_TRIRA|nr:26S proteasome non-ATPase regulatory subunit 12 [Triplophysa rosa]KAI7807403.1 26S proteasome non-ATPase regulatory subunit 12 [Triplophysa rosa]
MSEDRAERSDGRIVKMEVDYTATVDQRLPECEKMAKEGRLQEAVESLLSLEKQTRTASDMVSTSKILVAIARMCYEAKDWDALNENIMLLSKRRSQLKQAVAKMVQECYTYVDAVSDLTIKLRLIDTLRTVTAGKIYVEIERARLTKILAHIKEQSGDVKEAASIVQELQVETYGSMEKKEKVEFILEQMRLCIAVKDYIRTQIISKKINTKFFQDEGTEELKLKYYNLMIQVDQHEGSYLSICKHYLAIYDTPSILEDSLKWQQALKSVVLYVILAPYDNEQSDLVHRISTDKKLEEIPTYRDLLKKFTTMELMSWSCVVKDYGKELRESSMETPDTDVFTYSEEGEKRWKNLKNRVVEHNIRIMAKYYTRITMERMAGLLDLSVDESEEFLSNLVVNKTIYAKVDRLAGVINFQRPKDPNNLLNDWSHKLNSLMSLVNKTTHLIAKEEMIHNLQ